MADAAWVENENELSHWLEWKRVCAWGGCGPAARDTLLTFGDLHFSRNLRRYAGRVSAGVAGLALPARDAWHLLETHLTIRSSAQGKRYKDWLFLRAGGEDGFLGGLRSGASLLMRDVVREYLRQEFRPAGTVSMDQPMEGVGGGGLTLGDLLPGELDPADGVEGREYERLAERHAGEFFASATKRQKLALAARQQGLGFASAAVYRAAGVGRAAVGAAYDDFVRRVGKALKLAYRDDGDDAILRLTLMTITCAKKLAGEWKNVAEGSEPTLMVVKQGVSGLST